MQKMEQKNKMGKTSDHFNKIGNTKGTLHAKMGTINNINGMDVTEAEDNNNRWKEYKEDPCPPKKKIVLTQITMMV